MRRPFYLSAGCLALTLLPACASVGGYERAKSANMTAELTESVPGDSSSGMHDSYGVASVTSTGGSAPAAAAAPPPPPPPPPSPAGNVMASPMAPPPASTPPAQGAPATPAKPHAGEVAAVQGPMLIYTAEITLAVFEVKESLGKVEALAREMGGFLSRRADTSITIRVPAARFDEAVKRIEKIGDMLHRNVVAEDVTEEFHDLDVRLRSARAVQERLTQLLAKAVKVEDSVMIERELDRVTGEIERLEGRLKFLRDRAAYSTITVTFQPKATETLGQSPFRVPAPWLNELGLGRLLQL